VSDEKAVFTEPLAAALGVAEQVEIGAETRTAVIGDGKLGLLCAMGLTLRSKSVTLIGRHAEKMKLAEPSGIRTVVSNRVEELSNSFDVVVEASGSDSGFASAVDLVRPRGKIILKSTFQGKPTWPASRIVVEEISVVGSRCGRFEQALAVLKYELIDPTPMIVETRPLIDGVAAMSRAAEKGTLKVLLKP
jgi:threonine dehydrogenase-like Zn-dependent dehydrogenase